MNNEKLILSNQMAIMQALFTLCEDKEFKKELVNCVLATNKVILNLNNNK